MQPGLMLETTGAESAPSGNRGRGGVRWASLAPPRPPVLTILVATTASVVGLAILGALAVGLQVTLLIPSMAASMALIMGAPALPLAQPRNVVGGQVVSAVIGVLVGLFGDSWWLAAIAGGVALGVMMLLRVSHSPAAATAFIGVTASVAGWEFVLCAAIAATMLVVIGVLGNRAISVCYPRYIW